MESQQTVGTRMQETPEVVEKAQSNSSSSTALSTLGNANGPAHHNRASSLSHESLKKVGADLNEQPRTNYKLRKIIGKGTYSTVYLASAPKSTGLLKSRSSLDISNMNASSEEVSSTGTNADVVSQISEVLPES